MGCGLQAHRLLILVLGDTWGGVELGGGEATLIQGPGRESGSPKLMLCISTLKRFQDLSSLLCTPVFLSRDDSFLKIVLMWDTSQSLRSMGQTTVPVLPTTELWGRWKCLRSRCSLPGDRECATPAPGPARPPVLSPVTGPSTCTSQCPMVVFPFRRGLKELVSEWRSGKWMQDQGPLPAPEASCFQAHASCTSPGHWSLGPGRAPTGLIAPSRWILTHPPSQGLKHQGFTCPRLQTPLLLCLCSLQSRCLY